MAKQTTAGVSHGAIIANLLVVMCLVGRYWHSCTLTVLGRSQLSHNFIIFMAPPKVDGGNIMSIDLSALPLTQFV